MQLFAAFGLCRYGLDSLHRIERRAPEFQRVADEIPQHIAVAAAGPLLDLLSAVPKSTSGEVPVER